jgi:hypothetical protein
VEAVRPHLDDAGIRRYLLGLLPQPEAEALEEEYFARPDVLERVRGVEDDLLDDHAAGRLGPDEQRVFESRYLGSPLLRDRVLAARALRLAAVAGGVPTVRVVAARPRPWAHHLAIAAGLLVGVLAFWIWTPRPPEVTTASAPATSVARPETPPPELVSTPSPAAVPSPSVPQRAPTASRVVLALSPVRLRGQGAPAEVRIPPGTGTVVLELEGDPALLPRTDHSLEVVVTTVEGRRVWGGQARRITERGRPALLVSAAVPADRLPLGDYLVTLSSAGEIVHRYFFRIPGR